MTDDEIWHQSTVMERCEILRAQVHRLMKANAWVHPDSEPMGPVTVRMHAELVDARDWDRLKRIEAEANDFLNWCPTDRNVSISRFSSVLIGLREALKR
jgi:hypothetical protein